MAIEPATPRAMAIKMPMGTTAATIYRRIGAADFLQFLLVIDRRDALHQPLGVFAGQRILAEIDEVPMHPAHRRVVDREVQIAAVAVNEHPQQADHFIRHEDYFLPGLRRYTAAAAAGSGCAAPSFFGSGASTRVRRLTSSRVVMPCNALRKASSRMKTARR